MGPQSPLQKLNPVKFLQCSKASKSRGKSSSAKPQGDMRRTWSGQGERAAKAWLNAAMPWRLAASLLPGTKATKTPNSRDWSEGNVLEALARREVGGRY